MLEIPFTMWSAEAIVTYNKRATSRRKQYGVIDDVFMVGDNKYQLDLVVKLPLWFIAKELYESEGCLSPHIFKMIWRAIYGSEEWNGNELVWYHHFHKQVEEPKEDQD